VRLRSLGDALIVDDKLAYGEKILVRDDAIVGSGSIRGCKSEIVAMQEQVQTNLVHLL